MNRRIFDAHCDTILRSSAEKEFVSGGSELHVDLPSLLKSGVHDQVMAACIKPYIGREKEMWQRGIRNYKEFRNLKKPRLHFALEGCLPLAMGFELPFHPVVASLTWNGDNPYAGGIGSEMDLTDPGRELAEKFAANGTMLDVSHLNRRSRKSLLKMEVPVCATHCNAQRLCNGHARNLPDEDIKEIADSGGVIGITFVPDFLEEDGSKATIASIINHMEYIAELTSIDSVGFGSDFDGVKKLPEGLTGAGSWFKVIDALESRGWSNSDIDKAAGNNWRRFFKMHKER
ncbi:MAG: membrane dipeptidase [Candidatus Fermentibacteria bacterium]|nr:membrane dipeptidase [Candidatus Fermentibacteria bacterium]